MSLIQRYALVVNDTETEGGFLDETHIRWYNQLEPLTRREEASKCSYIIKAFVRPKNYDRIQLFLSDEAQRSMTFSTAFRALLITNNCEETISVVAQQFFITEHQLLQDIAKHLVDETLQWTLPAHLRDLLTIVTNKKLQVDISPWELTVEEAEESLRILDSESEHDSRIRHNNNLLRNLLTKQMYTIYSGSSDSELK